MSLLVTSYLYIATASHAAPPRFYEYHAACSTALSYEHALQSKRAAVLHTPGRCPCENPRDDAGQRTLDHYYRCHCCLSPTGWHLVSWSYYRTSQRDTGDAYSRLAAT
ncbi:hypothetical protein CSPX01_08820 [Colletotrichum filicis]|nr:hypothetical protein CSPX01_08820 [Colletotrichum filicis]